MSCGGSMMRGSPQPLAHLVDAAAERWLAVEHASDREKLLVTSEITQAFRIGDNAELTFHGLRFLLTVSRCEKSDQFGELCIEVHQIASNH